MTDTKRWIDDVRRVEPPDLWGEMERRATLPRDTRQRDDRRPIRTLAILLVAAAVVGSSLYALRGLGSSKQRGPAAVEQVIRYRVDGAPQPIAAGEGAAWVDVSSISARGTGPTMISRIDSQTGTVTPLPDTLGALWVITGEGAVWATCIARDCGGSGVLELDPSTGKLLHTISIPDRVNHIAMGLGAVWVSTETGLTKIDPTTGSVVGTVPGRYDEIGVGGPSIWAMAGNGVVRVDPSTGDELSRVSFPNPCYLDATAELVFLASCGGSGHEAGDELLAIDAWTGQLLYRVPLSAWGQMRLVGNTLWIAENDLDKQNLIRLVPLDAQTGQAAGVSIEVERGRQRFSLPMTFPPNVFFAVDGGYMWLTDYNAGEVIRVAVPSARSSTTEPTPIASTEIYWVDGARPASNANASTGKGCVQYSADRPDVHICGPAPADYSPAPRPYYDQRICAVALDWSTETRVRSAAAGVSAKELAADWPLVDESSCQVIESTNTVWMIAFRPLDPAVAAKGWVHVPYDPTGQDPWAARA